MKYLRNAVLLATAFSPTSVVLGVDFLRGDVDESGALEITDAIRVLRFLFLGDESVGCLDAADADDDGLIAVTDAVAVLGHLYRGSPPPPAPHLACGPDATADELGCETYAGCPLPRFTFFGVEFEADGVFFVIDRSPPLSGNGILTRAKEELAVVIDGFPAQVQFGLAFFDRSINRFPTGELPANATDEMKSSAKAMVQSISGGGGTCPQAGLTWAILRAQSSTSSKKILVFLTDGGGTCAGNDERNYLRSMVSGITELNDSTVQIHALGAHAGDFGVSILQDLAEQNGGTYTQVAP